MHINVEYHQGGVLTVRPQCTPAIDAVIAYDHAGIQCIAVVYTKSESPRVRHYKGPRGYYYELPGRNKGTSRFRAAYTTSENERSNRNEQDDARHSQLARARPAVSHRDEALYRASSSTEV